MAILDHSIKDLIQEHMTVFRENGEPVQKKLIGIALGDKPTICPVSGMGRFVEIAKSQSLRNKLVLVNYSSSSDVVTVVKTNDADEGKPFPGGIHYSPSVLLVCKGSGRFYTDFVLSIPLGQVVHVFPKGTMAHYWIAHSAPGELSIVNPNEVEEFEEAYPDMAGKLNDTFASETA
jgi:hypothetical protein